MTLAAAAVVTLAAEMDGAAQCHAALTLATAAAETLSSADVVTVAAAQGNLQKWDGRHNIMLP